MKILKNILIIMIISILLFGATKIYAYDGLVDAESEVTISETLVNGKGEISLTRNIQNYEMYYQYVEIDNELYKQIRKLKDELLIIQCYNIWETDQTDENYDIYVSTYLYYQEKYNETADDYTENRIDEIQSIIISLLPDYADEWIVTTNNKINIDLSKFTGIKDYVVWVKVNTEDRTIYDAEVYELEGTKTNNNDDENQKPGINIDLQDEITLPEILINGEGTVTITRNIKDYKMYYQYTEIDSELYKQIRKLKDELLVAQYYNIWETDQTDENYDIYESAYLYYKDKYNETVDDYTEKRIDEVQSIIISLLPQYAENWIPTTENKVNIDLSSFSGIKNYVVWVKVETDSRNIYDAEVYQLEGTKKEDDNKPDDDNKPGEDDNKPGDDDNKPGEDDNKPGDDDNKPGEDDNKPGDDDNKPGEDDNKPGDDDNKPGEDDNKPGNDDNKPEEDDNKPDDDNNKVDNTNKITSITKGDTTTSSKKMPYTGATSTIMQISIIGAIVMSIFTFIRMKKIK